MLQGHYVEKYVKLLTVTSIEAVKCILPLLFDSPSYIHHQELGTVLLNYHIGRFVLGSLYVGDLVRLGLSSVCVAG